MAILWVITENNLAGTENQCLGIAQALKIAPVIKRIGLRQPWKTLSPWMGHECARAFTGDSLMSPWPDIVIAGGRKAVAAARYIKKKNPKTFTVFVQNPRISPRHFDIVAAPAHDGLRGENILTTQATPNMITPALLSSAREKFAPLLEPLPGPRVAVLIGGNSRAHRLTPATMDRLTSQLKDLAAEGYSLMVTASRRTPPECREMLDKTFPSPGLTPLGHPLPQGEGSKRAGPSATGGNYFVWDGTGDNPYHGFLAWADYIIVTADSASMLSEAATTGKPVYMAALEGGSARFDQFHSALFNKGIIRKFEGKLESYGYTPLNDAAMVASEIRKRWKTC